MRIKPRPRVALWCIATLVQLALGALLLTAYAAAMTASATGCARAAALFQELRGYVGGEIVSDRCSAPRRGFVSVALHRADGVTETQVWWTSNAGLSWFRTNRVGANVFGAGTRVYWTVGGTLFGLSRWPSLSRARRSCRRYARGGLCVEPRFVEAGIQSTRVLMLDDAQIGDTATLRDGFAAALLNTRDGLPPRALVAHGGALHIADLPEAGWTVCGKVFAHPAGQIRVPGCDHAGARVLGEWISRDGGRTWTIAPVAPRSPVA